MKTKLKKILCIVLAIFMVSSIFNVTVFAAEYTVTYMPGEGVEGEPYYDVFTTTITIRSATYTREHYTQTGWAIEDGGILKYRFGTRYRTKKDVVLYPVWEGEECTISYSPGQYGKGEETIVTASYGKTFILSDAIFTREGYIQTGWSLIDGGEKSYDLGRRSDVIEGDITLYPYFAKIHTILYVPGSYGAGEEVAESVENGEYIKTLDAIFTREGYTQTGWSLEDSGDMAYGFNKIISNITQDITLYPYWVENECGSNFHHTWENGTCSVCGVVCGIDVEHVWNNGECVNCGAICGTDVEHSWENGKCTICEAICGTDTEHIFGESVCKVCGIICGTDMEHAWKTGVCSTCGFTCEHNYENGICPVCSDYEPAILVTSENYESLNLTISYLGYYAVGNIGQIHWFRDFVNSNKQLSGADTEDDTTDDIFSNSANAVLINDIDMNPEYMFDFDGAIKNGTPSIYDKNGNQLPEGSLNLLHWNTGIGVSEATPYTGVFDGNSLTITDVVFLNTGLFNYNEGIIKNLNVCNSYGVSSIQTIGLFCTTNSGEILNCNNYSGFAVSAEEFTGGICGYNDGGIISGCVNYGYVVYGGGICARNAGVIENCYNASQMVQEAAAGIAAYNYDTIKNCYNIADMADIPIGAGICFLNWDGTIENCYNTGDIKTTYNNANGICLESAAGTIKNCYNTGDISGLNSGASGICGNSNSTIFVNCHNTGKITGNGNYVGAICGNAQYTTIENCYYLEGCATDGNGVTQNGVGNETLGITTEDVEGSTIAKTAEQFASGEVCYLLNSGVIDGTQAFYQNIDNSEEVDAAPVFSGGTVYKVGPCTGIKEYTNIEADAVCEHMWEKGVCSNCELICEHIWENGKCTTCKSVCGTDVEHIWENGECKICDAICGVDVEHTWKDGVCSICSAVCEHDSFDSNGFCAECGIAYEPAILVTEDNYISLNLTEDYIGYYAIKNAGQLYWFSEFVNSHTQLSGIDTADDTTDDIFSNSANAVLLNDIDINPGYKFNSDGTVTYNGKEATEGYREWVPIGSIEKQALYGGAFDGNNHCVKSVYINSTKGCTALFEANIGTIKSLGIENSYIIGQYYVAGICGSNIGTIVDCYSSDSYFSGEEFAVGGICGGNGGTITDCYSSANLWGTCYIGGICGSNEETISNCYFYGDFAQPLTSFTGGICGSNNGTITECYNLADLVGTAYVGGICGENNDTGVITECYNCGKITGNPEEEQSCGIAGICGYGEGGTIKNCYNVGAIGETGRCVGAICGQSLETTIENCYYLEGCATDGNGVTQNGVGNETLGMTTEDVEGSTIAKTAEQFASGEVCYLLNSGVIDGTQVFYQNIDNGEEVDSAPVFSGGTVYKVGPCTGIKEYTNIEADAVCEHSWENDVCSVCGLSMLKSVSDKTEIDHTGKSIFTELLLCKFLDEIVTVIEGYTTKLTASFGDYIGTGSTVEVLDSDANTVSTYTVVVENDVNGDSVCDVLDCAQVARVISGYDSFEGVYKLAADSDNNGEIDINDYQAIVNAALQ